MLYKIHSYIQSHRTPQKIASGTKAPSAAGDGGHWDDPQTVGQPTLLILIRKQRLPLYV